MARTRAHHGARHRKRHVANAAAMRVPVFARHTRDPSRCRAKPTCRLASGGTVCRHVYLAHLIAPRIRFRLRPTASRARGAQRRLGGSAGAAVAARWRRTFCTSERSLDAGPAHGRTQFGRSFPNNFSTPDGSFMARSMSTAATPRRALPTQSSVGSSGCRTTPDWSRLAGAVCVFGKHAALRPDRSMLATE